MNLKKYFNLSFEESEKITSKVGNDEAKIVKKLGFNKMFFLKGFVVTLFFELIEMLLGFFMYVAFADVFPNEEIIIAIFWLLSIVKIITFGIIFLVASKTTDRLVYDFVMHLFMYLFLISTIVFFIFGIIFNILDKKIFGDFGSAALSILYIFTALNSLFYSVSEWKVRSKSPIRLEKLTGRVFKKSGFLLLFFILKVIFKMFSGNFSFTKDIEVSALAILAYPIIIFVGIYVIFCYYPLHTFIPLIYLSKYRKQYEEKYGVNFKGGKN
ncbi:hypothetical protein [Xylocopilactobacillus apicola]|uniref:Uncharacterized protein n=1 Tax=Xylocopilactobacillus apicola TaxID=2932184 RepID=A0AAU9D7E2_9LACO|nr:hypothetical protein [Xylocopilactobacillus apicola]BDR59458.1 hypothetical protein XA3_18990 [Xylocopilactobacillus apicola]